VRFAVLRFPGSRSEENEKAAVEKLRAWLEGQKIVGLGTPFLPATIRRGHPSRYGAMKC